MKKNELVEPMAKKVDKILKMHDHERNDEFYWLNERGNQEVVDYLNAENDYRDAYMKDYKSLENELFEEIKSRMQGWQLSTFEESYNHKINQGISLFKKKLLEG